jgi:hypothetical protein
MNTKLTKVITFLKALLWHIYSGSPKSSQKEIDERYKICLSCDRFNGMREECMVCGCVIKNKRIFLNKLAWADQECPLGKWHKIQKGS